MGEKTEINVKIQFEVDDQDYLICLAVLDGKEFVVGSLGLGPFGEEDAELLVDWQAMMVKVAQYGIAAMVKRIGGKVEDMTLTEVEEPDGTHH